MTIRGSMSYSQKLRPLSLTAAQSCENAVTPKSACRCRCGGAHHGAARVIHPNGPGEERAAYLALPEDDPHHVPALVVREPRVCVACGKNRATIQREDGGWLHMRCRATQLARERQHNLDLAP